MNVWGGMAGGGESSERSEPSPYMTIGDLAQYLKLPTETVYRYVREGRIPGSKVGRHWRFLRWEVDRWVSEQRHVKPRQFRALVVEADPSVRSQLLTWLREIHGVAEAASSGEEALFLLRREPSYQFITLDLQMPGRNGVEMLREIRRAAPHIIILIVTSDCEGSLLEQVMDAGPVLAMKKPVQREGFVTLVNSLIGCGRGIELTRT
jgi:excisionase family DNA binding protein